MKTKIIMSVLFVLGFSIFFYPMISNWFSTQDHYQAISKYHETLKNMSTEEKETEKKKAETYNDSLQGQEAPLIDPFSEDEDNADHDIQDSYYNALNIGETMGSIEIPKLKTDLPIYHGVDHDVLQQGVGHMSNSSLPIGGKGTHTALTAHRGLPSAKLFRDLDQLAAGDTFYIHTLDETLAYEVDDVQVVTPDQTKWLHTDMDDDYATLVTCTPYMINTERLLVRGTRVPYEADTPMKSLETKDSSSFSFSLLFVLMAIALTGAAVIIHWLRIRVAQKGGSSP